jgi:hypothetical protein
LKNGTAALSIDSFVFTMPTATQIASYSAIGSTEFTGLVGQATGGSAIAYLADATTGGVIADKIGNFGMAISTTGTAVTCGTQWATTANACAGVDKWGYTDSTSTTTTGSIQAWMWLADNVDTPSAVFGVEKDDTIDVIVHQQTAWVPGASNGCTLPDATYASTKLNTHRNNWGVATFTGTSGASATLLGASAVLAALVSFF